MKANKILNLFLLLMLMSAISAVDWNVFNIGRLHYSGGGDWYSNPSSLPNLLQHFSKTTGTKTARRDIVVQLSDSSFKRVPIIYFTGHGKIHFSEKEKTNLRWFLKNGGFLIADDNFGMNITIRRELNSLLAGSKLQELPINHKIFKAPFKLNTGLPKIHKHYGGAPIAYGLFIDNRMVAFYGYNTDLGDGWEDISVHKDSPEKHELALRMGSNILWYALNHGL